MEVSSWQTGRPRKYHAPLMQVFGQISWLPGQAADQTFLLKKEKKLLKSRLIFFIPHF